MFICSVTLNVVSKTDINDTPRTPTNCNMLQKRNPSRVPRWPSFWPGYDPVTLLRPCLPSAPISPAGFPNEKLHFVVVHAPQVFSVVNTSLLLARDGAVCPFPGVGTWG